MLQPLYPLERHPSTHPLARRLSALRNRSGGGGGENETLKCTCILYFELTTTSDISFVLLKFPQPPSRSSPHLSLLSRSQNNYNTHCKVTVFVQ